MNKAASYIVIIIDCLDWVPRHSAGLGELAEYPKYRECWIFRLNNALECLAQDLQLMSKPHNWLEKV